MKPRQGWGIVTALFIFSTSAVAQESLQLNTKSHLPSMPDLDSKNDTLTGARFWRTKLVSAGVIADTGPIRMGLPLLSLGAGGPQLRLTYGPKSPNGAHMHGTMITLSKEID